MCVHTFIPDLSHKPFPPLTAWHPHPCQEEA
ncbi:hypothetical protein E2C01_070040 [Portunus trituberculatus]|uniref:Uncharacterized protein n=1 Tax=Portunus trituberculatus TaxID=210409 RepID=A0A5B7I2H8_PORTR|nr:hypothetical protein [Portunus trituberculatus]